MGHSSIGYGVPSTRVWCSSACMFFPSNSVGSSYPSRHAAARLMKRQVPSGSQPKIASEAESRMIGTKYWLMRSGCYEFEEFVVFAYMLLRVCLVFHIVSSAITVAAGHRICTCVESIV